MVTAEEKKQLVLLDSGMRRNDGSSTKSEPNDPNDLNIVSYKRGPPARLRSASYAEAGRGHPDLSGQKLCRIRRGKAKAHVIVNVHEGRSHHKLKISKFQTSRMICLLFFCSLNATLDLLVSQGERSVLRREDAIC